MPTTQTILVALLCASPAILLWDGLIAQGIVAEVVAIALVIAARALRPGETGFLISVIRPLLAVAAVPALWMLVQVLPLPPLAHPIWASAAAALGHPLAGSISVDPGATIIALGLYLSMVAVAFLSAAVALDRQRAEWLLFALTLAAAAIGLLLLFRDFLAGTWPGACATTQAIDCVALGIIFACATCIGAIERVENRQLGTQRSGSVLRSSILQSSFYVACAALAICCVALLFSATMPTLFATGYGLLALVCVMLTRRFGLGFLGILGFVIPPIGAALLLLAAHPIERGTSVTLAFTTSAPALSALSQHMLDDAPLVGTGAGTFVALAPIYRAINDPASNCSAATSAATFAIELGQPILWFVVVMAAAALVMLLRASLQRGRDSFYPAMGGSSLLTILLLSFTNTGLLGTATGLLVAAALGLAFAQSRSRTAN